MTNDLKAKPEKDHMLCQRLNLLERLDVYKQRLEGLGRITSKAQIDANMEIYVEASQAQKGATK